MERSRDAELRNESESDPDVYGKSRDDSAQSCMSMDFAGLSLDSSLRSEDLDLEADSGDENYSGADHEHSGSVFDEAAFQLGEAAGEEDDSDGYDVDDVYDSRDDGIGNRESGETRETGEGGSRAAQATGANNAEGRPVPSFPVDDNDIQQRPAEVSGGGSGSKKEPPFTGDDDQSKGGSGDQRASSERKLVHGTTTFIAHSEVSAMTEGDEGVRKSVVAGAVLAGHATHNIEAQALVPGDNVTSTRIVKIRDAAANDYNSDNLCEAISREARSPNVDRVEASADVERSREVSLEHAMNGAISLDSARVALRHRGQDRDSETHLFKNEAAASFNAGAAAIDALDNSTPPDTSEQKTLNTDAPVSIVTMACASHLDEARAPGGDGGDNDNAAVVPLSVASQPELKLDPAFRPYSMRDVFSVVYEEQSTKRNVVKRQPVHSPVKSQKDRKSIHATSKQCSPAKTSSSTSTVEKTNSTPPVLSSSKDLLPRSQASPQSNAKQQHILSLQKQLGAVQRQLKHAEQMIKMQQVAEAEMKKIKQRNVRLKQQTDALAMDLQRTKAENARLRCENELYAAKLPHLQKELQEESCQADEKHAQAVQMQLSLAQLRARVQVLQNRNEKLEAQSESVRGELRECRKELRNKNAALVATTDKMTKVEADANALQSAHAQELMHWRNKMTSTMQRFELERAKHASELSRQRDHQLAEAKTQATRARGRQRELAAAVAKLEDDLKLSRREADTAKLELQKQAKEAHKLEGLLRKAHRAEATLQQNVKALRTRMRDFNTGRENASTRGKEQKKPRRQAIGDKLLFPLDLLLEELECGSENEDMEPRGFSSPSAQHCKCCALLLCDPESLDQKQREFDEPAVLIESGNQQRRSSSTLLPCCKCDDAQARLQDALDEIHRLRLIHSSELKVQAMAYTRMLQIGNRGNAGGAGGADGARGAATTGSVAGSGSFGVAGTSA